MHIKKILLASVLSLGLLHAENSVGLNLNNEDLELLGSANLNALTNYANGTAYAVNASYLYSDGDNLSTVGISGENSFQGLEGLKFAFGAKLVLASEFVALPLFAKAAYEIPLNDSIPSVSLSTSLAYAPPVLTFRDGEKYSEFRVEAAMEVITNIHLFTGYRNIKTDYSSYDKTFNNSFYGGMKLSF